jgi:hypothetical protein
MRKRGNPQRHPQTPPTLIPAYVVRLNAAAAYTQTLSTKLLLLADAMKAAGSHDDAATVQEAAIAIDCLVLAAQADASLIL